jgi:hypothetical protein
MPSLHLYPVTLPVHAGDVFLAPEGISVTDLVVQWYMVHLYRELHVNLTQEFPVRLRASMHQAEVSQPLMTFFLYCPSNIHWQNPNKS